MNLLGAAVDASLETSANSTSSGGTRPQSVVDQVTDSILRMILGGELPAGEPVAIQELSERLEVSHIPVREALRRLETRGLVTFRRGRRPQITAADPQDFEDLFRLRSIIEADVASRSARLLTPERMETVQRLFADMEATMRGGHGLLAYPTHTNFHLALLPGASRWDLQMLEQLWVATERYIQMYVGDVERDPDSVDFVVESHRELMEVAGRGKARDLRRAVVEHIKLSYDTILPTVVAARGG